FFVRGIETALEPAHLLGFEAVAMDLLSRRPLDADESHDGEYTDQPGQMPACHDSAPCVHACPDDLASVFRSAFPWPRREMSAQPGGWLLPERPALRKAS